MKYKTKRRIQGSISVLLVIILLPSMVLSALVVDTSRINMARSMVSSAGDLAINSALANYDTVLKDVYGLFAMSQAQTPEELNKEIQQYFQDTLVSYGVTNEAESGDYVKALMGSVEGLISGTGSLEVSNFLSMEVEDGFKAQKVDASGLSNPEIMRKQVVDYMKYRAPANFALSFLDSITAFNKIDDQTKVVQAQVVAQESLQPVTQGCRTVIDDIRAYDKKVISIDKGEEAVRGSANSTDGEIVYIKDYHTQMDKYKEIWGEKYQNVNELNLIFLLKTPDVSDKALSKLKYFDNQFFITDTNEINPSNVGVTVNVSVAGDIEGAKTQTEGQINKLKTAPYTSIRDGYPNFLDRLNLDINKTAFDKREAAISTFIAFEGFLLNDTSLSSITYEQVKDLIEQLCVLERYQSNYINLYTAKITEKTNERNAKQREANDLHQQAEVAQNAVSTAKQKKADYEAAKNAYDNASSEFQKADQELKAAVDDFNKYVGSELSERYKQLSKKVDEAEAKYSEKNENKNNAQSALDAASDGNYTDDQIARMQSDANAKQTEYEEAQSEYESLVTEVQKLEVGKEGAKSDYANLVSMYQEFTRQYQHDLELYGDYQAVAKKEIEKDVKAIQKQSKQIEDNILALMNGLEATRLHLDELEGYIRAYQGNVDKWDDANGKYASANSTDSFSEQNQADIKATEHQYNLDSLNTLRDYVVAIHREYQNFYDYITDANNYKYGTGRIDALQTAEAVKQAVPASVKNALPQIVKKTDADNQLDVLYPTANAPAIVINGNNSNGEPKYTFVTDGVLPIQFLMYLNSNFPEEAQNITLQSDESGQTSDPKKQYDDMKKEMSDDKKGQETIDSKDGNVYGYTYDGKTVSKNASMPSYGESAKEAGTKSMSIGTNGDKVNVSSGMGQQSSSLGQVLQGVGKVMETGMENAYLVDYIFENFSYNTQVQELVVKGEGYEKYTEVMNLAHNSAINSYKGKAKTLSNYNICGANNYLYGAEIEYILFGNSTPGKNIAYTKGSIYTIRFGFNCVFAFTNSEIKNTTRAVGLAVQAATAGLVPYQVVQVVLQLALAAAESAVDLDMMSKGLKVVVVKSKDTWTMSASGAMNMISDAVKTVGGNLVGDAIDTAINKVNEGINTVMEASAEELEGAVDDLVGSVENAANAKAQEVIDTIYAQVQGEIDNVLNRLEFEKYAETSQAQVENTISGCFRELRDNIDSLQSGYADNPIAEAIMPTVKNDINKVIGEVEQEIIDMVKNAYIQAGENIPDVGSLICEKMLQLKYDIINKLQNSVSDVGDAVEKNAKQQITSVTDELKSTMQSYVVEKGTDLKDTAVTKVKEELAGKIDSFTNTYLKEPTQIGTGKSNIDQSKGSSVASMIKFGYKDYLMLFVFISVCANDEAVLGRMGDVIQMNMQNATGIADEGLSEAVLFQHKKGKEFKLSDAKTYVSVQGTVKLDMLFLDMDFFNRLLADEGTDVEEQLKAASTIEYKSMAGY